ncbi:MAG: tetratricopeptide repeat protein [Bacteroidetes bacterium]|nr:tetratricopeptide repeat protein [Bacteroidota bacterium]MCL5268059.1 tetratricopeptide repeat protein [Bacteroidota bacterium]
MKSLALSIAVLCLTAFSTQSLQELISQSDAIFDRFDNNGALEILLKANQEYPHSSPVLWRLCRVETHIADHMPVTTDQQKKAQLETYTLAYDYADSAVMTNPKSSMAYTYRAVANGKIALFKGVFSVAPIVKKVRSDCEQAIKLDPDNAIAYYVLGRTHAKLAEKPSIFLWPLGLSWGNMKDAIKFYRKAISLDPNFIMFRYDLARAYVREDEYKDAREQLQALSGMPQREQDDDSLKVEASKLLNEIKDKK